MAIGFSSAQAAVTLQVSPVQGGADLDIDFGTTRSLGPQGELESDTVVRRVKLTITSDSSKPYLVFQRINSAWNNATGKEFPGDSVRFFVTASQAGGAVRFPNPTALSVGEEEIFLSDSTGSDQELLVTYTVKVPVGQEMGHYRTTLTFRVVSQ